MNEYSIQLWETSDSSTKWVKELGVSNTYTAAIGLAMNYALRRNKQRLHVVVLEKENTGCWFTRLHIDLDGRPFCKSPNDMGPDKYGSRQAFTSKEEFYK